MALYIVRGIRKIDRADVCQIYEAASEGNAKIKAELDGIVVADVEEANTSKSTVASKGGEQLTPCNPTKVILLSIITLSIYGVIWFYQTGNSYASALIVKKPTNFSALFWWWFGLGVLGGLTLEIGIGIALCIASIVFGALALGEFLRLRDQWVAENNFSIPLTSSATHKSLWIIGNILSFIIIGIIILIIQAIMLMKDHNQLAVARRTQNA